MAEQKRDFKGVWIPKEIWLDTNLNMLEKGIFAEIDSLDDEETGCFASNKHLAEFCQCSETKVSTAITKLKNLGYIYEKSFDGRQRILKSRLSNFERQTIKNCKADCQNVKGASIRDTLSNTSINNIYISEFDELWQLYPRKQGKPNALKAYIKARKKGTTFEEVKQGIENYRMHIEAKGTATEYIKHGSTWFNQEAWNDEYDLMPNQKNGTQVKTKDNVEKWLKEDLGWALEIER